VSDDLYTSRFAGRIIDAHCHLDVAAKPIADRLFSGAQTLGCLNLWDVRWPPNPFSVWAGQMAELRPAMALCHTPDFSGVGLSRYEREIEHGIREAERLGAVGLKVWKNLGLWLTDVDGRLLSLQDDRLVVVWETAAELRLPVVIHVGDPAAFFAPLDERNERLSELLEHPDWWYGRGGFPTLEQLHEDFEGLVAAHPHTTFVGAHFGCFMRFDDVDRMLGTYENYSVDTSVQLAALGGSESSQAKDIIVRHIDRVLFGTDFLRTDFWDLPAPPSYDRRGDLDAFFAEHFRFFETGDTVDLPYPYALSTPPVGLQLADDLLKALYVSNARRVFHRAAWPTDTASSRYRQAAAG